jgi:hypothetical protein
VNVEPMTLGIGNERRTGQAQLDRAVLAARRLVEGGVPDPGADVGEQGLPACPCLASKTRTPRIRP